jgi:hypothetical protein
MVLFGRFLQAARNRQFHYLLGSLVLLLAIYPYVGAGVTGLALLRLLSTIILISGIYAVGNRRRQVAIAIILGVPAFAFGWVYVITADLFFNIFESIFTLLFYAFTACIVLYRVLASRNITTDTVYGAVSVYLLMGLTWATAYDLINIIHPGSFSSNLPGTLTFPDFIYYSFVTIATLGYGDITPLTAQARSLAILEAVSGTIFIAVLIARLVGALGWSSLQDRD